MNCPSCGRFTGPYEACPHCGARLQGRTPLRTLKIAALVFSLVGLAALWFAATRVQPPLVRLDQVGGLMNMAYVRIQGHVAQEPDYDPEGEYLAFWVSDDTGEVRVSVYRNETRELIAEGRVPAVGDRITVAGTLRIRQDFVALTLNAPRELEIERPPAERVEIGAIGLTDVGRRVQVRGQVRQVRQPYDGLTLITLRDSSGEIAVAVSEGLEALTGPMPSLVPGQTLEVTAAVSYYRDTPQLIPASTLELVPLSGSDMVAQERTIGSLSGVDVDTWVQVAGEIAEVDPFSGGIRFLLTDGTGQIVLLLWQSLYEQVPSAELLDSGARVRVQGSVAEYHGTLEIVPQAAQDIVLEVGAPPPEEVGLSAVSAADMGRTVVLYGILLAQDPFPGGVRYILSDGSSEIVLLLWEDIVEQAPAGLGPGVEVRVVGEIAEYEGVLEIVPRRGSDLELLGQTASPTATAEVSPSILPTVPPPGSPTPAEESTVVPTPASVPTAAPAPTATPEVVLIPLGDLPGMLGQEVTVEAVVTWIRSSSSGFSFLLDDGTGQVDLWMWLSVYDDCWDAPELAVGARVRAHGAVGQYEDRWQLEPGYGGDVQVLTPGSPLPRWEIGSITAEQLSQRLTVEGTVDRAESFSLGQRVYLSDASGTILVLLWQNIYERVEGSERLLAAGTAVRISGVVEEYQGTLQLVPQIPYSVVVLPVP